MNDMSGSTPGSQPVLFEHRRDVPFNELPKLPTRADVETVSVLRSAIGASRALADLRGVGPLTPNQGLFMRSMVLQEAKMSSEIENVVTTNDRLYRAFSDSHARPIDPNTKEVLHYEDALWHGFNAVKGGRPLSTSLFTELMQIIKETGSSIRTLTGIQVVNERTGEVIYTPPVGEKLIRDLLDNLSEYLYADDGVDALIKLAVGHYQFEAIHPFSDGNGRTGRVCMVLYLVDRGLLDLPVLYISQYILKRKSAYYDGLRRVTEEGALEDWVLFVLDAVRETAITTRDKIIKVRNAMDEAVELSRSRLGRNHKRELVELIFARPYTRIEFLVQEGIAKRQAASRMLQRLEDIGLVSRRKIGRDVLYVNETLMDILVG